MTANEQSATIIAKKRRLRQAIEEVSFVKLYQEALEHLFELDPTGLELKVLLGLAIVIDFYNRISCTQVAIGRKIGLSPQNVNEGFRGLVRKDVIYKLSDGYYLNPEYGFLGTQQQRLKLINRLCKELC